MVRYGPTRTDQWYVTVSLPYVTLHEGGKQALVKVSVSSCDCTCACVQW